MRLQALLGRTRMVISKTLHSFDVNTLVGATSWGWKGLEGLSPFLYTRLDLKWWTVFPLTFRCVGQITAPRKFIRRHQRTDLNLFLDEIPEEFYSTIAALRVRWKFWVTCESFSSFWRAIIKPYSFIFIAAIYRYQPTDFVSLLELYKRATTGPPHRVALRRSFAYYDEGWKVSRSTEYLQAEKGILGG
jgi:hypothetical protein